MLRTTDNMINNYLPIRLCSIYDDGYGKDHFFKPIAADTVATESDKEIKDNLDECLRVMEEKLQTFNSVQNDEQYDNDLTVHRPLMAFMGHTVENPKEEGKDDEVLTSESFEY